MAAMPPKTMEDIINKIKGVFGGNLLNPQGEEKNKSFWDRLWGATPNVNATPSSTPTPQPNPWIEKGYTKAGGGYYKKDNGSTIYVDKEKIPQDVISQVESISPTPQVMGAAKTFQDIFSKPAQAAGDTDKYIKQYFGDQYDNAYRTLKNENGSLNPRAENTYNSNGTVDRGVFQINSGTFNDFWNRKLNNGGFLYRKIMKDHGINSFEDMYDPEKNVFMAKLIYNEQGWDGWYGAPDDIISPQEAERRRNKDIGARE